MKNLFFIILNLLVLTLHLQAEDFLAFRHSDDFESVQNGQSYEGDNTPENGDPAQWQREGKSATLSTADGVLRYQIAENSTLRWKAAWWNPEMASKNGFTIEVRVRLEPGGEFVVMAGGGKLIIRENSVAWEDKVLASDVENTGRLQTYRITKLADGVGYDIWHNGESIAELEKGGSENEISFGSTAGGAEIDHVRWDTTGAYCP